MLKLLGKYEDEAEVDNSRLFSLARVMKSQLRRRANKQDDDFYSKLWSSIAPSGNIYRLSGAHTEMRKHTLDLQMQLTSLAEEYKDYLGGSGVPVRLRYEKIRDALLSTKVQGKISEEEGLTDGTYPALEEFCSGGVHSFGPLVIPDDPHEKKGWLKKRVAAFVIFAVQLIAPICMTIARIHEQRRMLTASYLNKNLNLKQAKCLGGTFDDSLDTILGFPLLYLVMFAILSYAKQEYEDSKKAKLCPQNKIWRVMSVVANANCCLCIIVTLPLLFITESDPSGLVLDSMGLLFLFSLDDLGTDTCSYIGMDSGEFQRAASWSAILLTQCPVRLHDLINANATDLDNLWCIKVDPEKGYLLTARGGRCQTRLESLSTALQHPETRSQLVSICEQIPLSQSKRQAGASQMLTMNLSEDQYVYKQSEKHYDLRPSVLDTALNFIWLSVTWLVTFMMMIVPPIWFVVSKTCQP